MAQHTTPKLRFPEFSGAWSIEPIGKYFDLLSGYAFKGEEISEDETGIPLMRGINITEGYIRHSKDIDRFYIGDVKKLNKYFLEEGDLVLGMDGSKVGKNVAVISNYDAGALLIQRVARLRYNGKANINYIYHHIFSKKFHDYVDTVNTSSGIPHISSQQIKDFTIGFPALPEQQKIASFLSAADKKLEQLQQKKTLLEQYKKGMMQKLFSQQIRFKDDEGKDFPEWEEKEFSEIAPLQRGFDLPNGKINEGEYPVVFSNGILKTHIEYKAQAPGVVMGRSGTIGKITFVEQNYWPHNTSLWVTDFKGNYPKYVYYLYLLFDFNAVSSGSTVPTLNRNDVHSKIGIIPSLAEQTKIAEFLTAIDAKIAAVSAQVAAAKRFKKGLLQQMFV